MSETKFDLKPVEKKPPRRYRKGSKYDPILDAFMEGMDNLAAVEVEGRDASYLQIQLNKRIKENKLGKKIKISVVNDVLYLEKINS